MGQHHRREDQPVTVAPLTLVAADAPPAGLGYPPPTAYRPDPVTGVPTPPRAVRPPAPGTRLRHRAPLAVAVVGAAVAVAGAATQMPDLALVAATPTTPTPTTARQCATVVADALDTTVATLGRTARPRWDAVVADREDALAATYGAGSAEHRAYAEGVDDVVGWLRDSGEPYSRVTVRVARGVATTCGWTG